MPSGISLKKGIHSSNQRHIVYVDGNTYPIRQSLKNFGFTWFASLKIWWMYEDNFDESKNQMLKRIGVDTSPYELSKQSNQPETAQPSPSPTQTAPDQQSPSPPMETPSVSPAPAAETFEELTNKRDIDKDYESKSSWYGFPIKDGIYQTSKEYIVDENPYTFDVIFNRRMYKDKTGKAVRKTPLYNIEIKFQGHEVGKLNQLPTGPWGTYNEDNFVREMLSKVQERFNVKEKSKIYLQFKYITNAQQRDPELIELIKDLGRYDDSGNKKESQNPINKTIFLEKYGVDVPVKISAGMPNQLGDAPIYFETNLKHKLAPSSYPQSLATANIPSNIKTVAEFHEFIDKFFQDNMERIKTKYLEYVDSFPFSEEDQNASSETMREITSWIGSNYDTGFFINKLVETGFLRKSKRAGILKDYVVDDKKAVSSAYKFSKRPEYFYGVLAYYLHRLVRNISSWTDMMLTMGISQFVDTAKLYDPSIDSRKVNEYFDRLTRLIYQSLSREQAPKSRWDQYSDFYGNGGRSRQNPVQPPIPNPQLSLEKYVQFAIGLGADQNLARQDPKTVYRQLVRKWHPDLNPPEKKEESNRIISQLSQLFNALPTTLTRASNWYQKQIFAQSKRKI